MYSHLVNQLYGLIWLDNKGIKYSIYEFNSMFPTIFYLINYIILNFCVDDMERIFSNLSFYQ